MLRGRKADKPEGANNRVKALRRLFKWSVANEHMQHNPAREVEYFHTGSTGHHTWTAEEVEQFKQRHPLGTKAYLAFALLYHTGARRSDVVRLGRQHMKDGWLRFIAHKNRNRKPVKIEIPVLPELQEAISAGPTGDMTSWSQSTASRSRPMASGTGFATAATRQGSRTARPTGCARLAPRSPLRTAPRRISS